MWTGPLTEPPVAFIRFALQAPGDHGLDEARRHGVTRRARAEDRLGHRMRGDRGSHGRRTHELLRRWVEPAVNPSIAKSCPVPVDESARVAGQLDGGSARSRMKDGMLEQRGHSASGGLDAFGVGAVYIDEGVDFSIFSSQIVELSHVRSAR